jgi:hypothetical protein
LWNLENGELLQTIENTRGAHWSADGTLLLTYAKDLDVAHVWDVALPPVDRQRRFVTPNLPQTPVSKPQIHAAVQ